ncbi:MAG: hypothetical protein Q9227_003019 [Pyrenula ochraceoflavens]
MSHRAILAQARNAAHTVEDHPEKQIRRIVDCDGIEIQNQSQQGEIIVKSPGTMLCYGGNTPETAAAKAGEWFRTGDIGYCKDDKWYIVDRAKDMIKVRAWQVSPAEVEACILQHPKILDAAVVGVPTDVENGETPVAFVVAQDPQVDLEILEGDIRAAVKQKLASYKAIGRVVFVDQIPRTGSGKILRRILREGLVNQSDGKC